MPNSAGLQAQKAVDDQVMSECNADAPKNFFPVFSESLSYDQLAEELSIFFGKPVSKNTLKNNWFSAGGRIDRIYQGLELPSPLKTDSGRVTPFGIAAVLEFAAEVHFGSKPYEDYVLSVRNHYLADTASKVGKVNESVNLPGSNASASSAIVPFVEVGNHQTVLPSPHLPQIYTLQALRTGESVQIDDPIALANQAVQAITIVQTVMNADIQNREQKLQETKQAEKMLNDKVQELKLDQRFYQEKANQIDSAQTQSTNTLQEALSVLQALGKPPSAAPTSPTDG